MDFANSWLDSFTQWTHHVAYCVAQPIQLTECRTFWSSVVLAVFVAGAFITVISILKMLASRSRRIAALRALEERARIDHDAIASRTWDGDKAYSASLGNEEVERRIREAIEQRRTANKPPSSIIVSD